MRAAALLLVIAALGLAGCALGHWREDAGYWSGGGVEVPQRDLWRVEARNGSPERGVYELVRQGDTWRLDRVWD